MAQVDAALLVDLGNLDPHHITDLAGIFDLFDAVVGKLRDVNKTVLTGSKLHERTERHQAHDAAIVQRTDLGNKHDIVDALLGGVAGLCVDGGDEDGAVIFDVDLRAGIGNDLLDDLAARADDFADLIGASNLLRAPRYAILYCVG